MMIADEADVLEQAIAWHLRLPEASAEEWRAFIEWLEASPYHAAIYDRLTLDDRSLVPPLELTVTVPEVANSGRTSARPWLWQSAAAAAMIAALLFGGLLTFLRPAAKQSRTYVVATSLGQTRSVQLSDGTQIDLNGGTRLILDRNNPRFAFLESGEAIFRVNHDPSSPFSLRSGEIELRDMGTVFNVDRQGRRLTVEVGDGAVMFQPNREAVVLRPGSQLTVHEDQSKVVIGQVDKASVGSWQRGWIVLNDASVAEAANAIERATGERIAVAPELGGKPFTGSIRLSGGAKGAVPRLAQLLGAQSDFRGGTWSITPHQHEVHPF